MIYKTTLSLLVAAFFSSAIFAAPTSGALITKTNHPGYVMPETALTETCEVFPNRVVITRHHGYDNNSLRLAETRNVRLEGNFVAVMEQARKEELTSKENGLCDGPSTHIAAGDLVLFSTGGCGTPKKERTGFASRKLRAIVDNFCAMTNDFGGEN